MALSLIIRRGSASAFPLALRAIGSSTTVNGTFSASLHVVEQKRNIHHRPLNQLSHQFSSATENKRKPIDERKSDEINCAKKADCESEVYTHDPDTFPVNIDDGGSSLHISRSSSDYDDYDDDDDEDDDVSIHIDNWEINGKAPGAIPFLVIVYNMSDPNHCLEFYIAASTEEIVIESMAAQDGHYCSEFVTWPKFKDLSEDVQRALHKYLEIRGIDLNIAKRNQMCPSEILLALQTSISPSKTVTREQRRIHVAAKKLADECLYKALESEIKCFEKASPICKVYTTPDTIGPFKVHNSYKFDRSLSSLELTRKFIDDDGDEEDIYIKVDKSHPETLKLEAPALGTAPVVPLIVSIVKVKDNVHEWLDIPITASAKEIIIHNIGQRNNPSYSTNNFVLKGHKFRNLSEDESLLKYLEIRGIKLDVMREFVRVAFKHRTEENKKFDLLFLTFVKNALNVKGQRSSQPQVKALCSLGLRFFSCITCFSLFYYFIM